MPLELRDIAVFLQVVDDGDFSAAARSLSQTPSAISKAIGRLEDHLGRRLLQRSSRSMRLTSEGERFGEAARHVLEAMQEAEAVGKAPPSGTLRIRCIPTFARYQLAPVMPRFQQQHASLQIEFILSNERAASLDDGADIAIASGDLPSSSLIARRIATSRWLTCASPGYLAAHGTPQSPAQLRDHACLNFSMPTQWNRWAGADSRIQAKMLANQGDMLLALARADAGIVRLAEFHISEDLRAGRLVALFPGLPPDKEESIYVLYQDRRNLSPRIAVFLAFLNQTFANPPWRHGAKPSAAGSALGAAATSPRSHNGRA